MENEQLQQAIGLVQTGDKTGAIKILKEIITKEPKNENAWLWLAACFDQPDNKVRSLQKVLEINPNNQKAKQALYKLTPTEPSLADIVPNTSQKSAVLQKPTKPQTEFLKDLLRNLAFLVGIGVVLYLIVPDMMKQVFQLYGMLFGPIAILLVIVAALPRKKRGKRWKIQRLLIWGHYNISIPPRAGLWFTLPSSCRVQSCTTANVHHGKHSQ